MKDVSFLIDYHIWANNKAIQELGSLTDEEWVKELGGSFPSPRLVSEHMVAADYRWLQRWKGVPIADIPASLVFESNTQLQDAWRSIMDEMKAKVDEYKDNMEQLVYCITARGDKFNMPFWQTLHHAVNHGTYHRGQITNMMRILGKKPVSTDMFLFFLETGR